MLYITIPAIEFWDEKKSEFIVTKEQSLQLEHSLVSVSKWESKWNKVFLSDKEKTTEEILDYVKHMTLSQNIDPSVYDRLTKTNIDQINDYIEAPMSAIKFAKEKTGGPPKDPMTNELIYFWMITLNIPFECQKWHLTRLLTLIQVCNLKNQPAKTKNSKDILSRNASLNASRKKQLNTRG